MSTGFVRNALCTCTPDNICASCRFCQTCNTSHGRKALCEKITRFLVLQLPYQRALQKAMEMLFPSKVVYDDEKDICTLLFESVLLNGENDCDSCRARHEKDHAEFPVMPSSGDRDRFRLWLTAFPRITTRHDRLVTCCSSPANLAGWRQHVRRTISR
jgi:hypothetical protein